jgi:hypothetical protein
MTLQRCGGCGQTRDTQFVVFKQNVSFLFRRRYQEFSGNLCFSCATKTFARFELATMFGTWWGIIGSCIGPFLLLHNLAEYVGAAFRYKHAQPLGLRRLHLPEHLRRGLLRLYLVVAVPWVVWFGYITYKANVSLSYNFSQLREFGGLSAILDDADPAIPQTPETRYARHELVVMALVWGAKTNDEISEHIFKAIELNDARLTTAIYALIAGLAPPLLYPIFLWVLAAFRHSEPITSEPRPAQEVEDGSPQPNVHQASPIVGQKPNAP